MVTNTNCLKQHKHPVSTLKRELFYYFRLLLAQHKVTSRRKNANLQTSKIFTDLGHPQKKTAHKTIDAMSLWFLLFLGLSETNGFISELWWNLKVNKVKKPPSMKHQDKVGCTWKFKAYKSKHIYSCLEVYYCIINWFLVKWDPSL